MLPLSFKEYISVFDDNNYQQLFLNYMRVGGMPGNMSILKTNPNRIDKYLDGIFSTIIYKDIMFKNNINDKMLLESILKFIFDSVGSPISTKKISDTLTSKGMSTSNHTVEKYITAFLESFLIIKLIDLMLRVKICLLDIINIMWWIKVLEVIFYGKKQIVIWVIF